MHHGRASSSFHKNVPLVSVKLGSQPPWYDDELRSLKKDLLVDKARAAAIRHPEDQTLVQYHKETEDFYRNESLQKELSYYDMSTISENSSSAEVSKKFFKHDNDNDRQRTRQQINKDASYVVFDERPRIDVFKDSFFYRRYIEWNSLSPDIRNISDHIKFSSELKDHLWNSVSIPPPT